MNVHNHARLTPSGRALMVKRTEQGWPAQSAVGPADVRASRLSFG
ncbi:leucine zipper domain-containing protein [Phenylobacterium sp.]|nr:hypothetical protein [Phenylobacterium sp.]MCA3753847.1 hypothetical protein [Phenylobacterium sp.]MCA3756329.1 hypothetical protein [Phenylobacterium sp.]MCA6272170.1 hypothetical protein [Phenylobacterium sp.]